MSWFTSLFKGKSLSLDEIAKKRHELTELREEHLELLNRINTLGVTSERGKAWVAARDKLAASIKAIETELIASHADTSSIPKAPTSVVIKDTAVLENPVAAAVATLPVAPTNVPAAPAAAPAAVSATAPVDAPAAAPDAAPVVSAAPAAAPDAAPVVSAAPPEGRRPERDRKAPLKRLRKKVLSDDEEPEPVADADMGAPIEEPEVPEVRPKTVIRADPEAEQDIDPMAFADAAQEEPKDDAEDSEGGEEEEEDEKEEEEEEQPVEALFGGEDTPQDEEELEEVVVDPVEPEKKESIFKGIKIGKSAAPVKPVVTHPFSVIAKPKKPYEYPENTQLIIKAARERVAASMGKRKAWRPENTNAYEIVLGVTLKGETWKHLTFLHTGARSWAQTIGIQGKQNAWREFRRTVCPLLRDQKHVIATDQVEFVVFQDWWDYHVNRFSMGLKDVVLTQTRPKDYYDVITAWDKRAARHAETEYAGITEEQRLDVTLVMQQCMDIVNRRMRDEGTGKDAEGHVTIRPRAGCRAVHPLYLLLAYVFALPSGFTPDELINRTHCDLFWELVHPNTKPIPISADRSVPAHELFYLLCDESLAAVEGEVGEAANAATMRAMRAFTRSVIPPVRKRDEEKQPRKAPEKRREKPLVLDEEEDDDDGLTAEERAMLRRMKKPKGTQGKNKRNEDEDGDDDPKRPRFDEMQAVETGRVPLDASRRVNWYDRIHPVTSHIPFSEAEQKRLDKTLAALEDDEDAAKFGASWMEGYTADELGLTQAQYEALPRRHAVYKLIPAARHVVYNAEPETLRLFLENCKALIYMHHFVDTKDTEGKYATPPSTSANIARDTTYERSARSWISVSVPDTRMRPLPGREVEPPNTDEQSDMHRLQWEEYQYDSTIRSMEFQEMLRVMEASPDTFSQFWNSVHARVENEEDFKSGDDVKRTNAVFTAISDVFLAPLENRLGGFWTLGRGRTIARASEDLGSRIMSLADSGGVVTEKRLRELGVGITFPYEPSPIDGKKYTEKLRRIIAQEAVDANARFAVHDPEDCARLRPARVLRPVDETAFVNAIRAKFVRKIGDDYSTDWRMPRVKSTTVLSATTRAAKKIIESAMATDVDALVDNTKGDDVNDVDEDEEAYVGEEMDVEEPDAPEEEEKAEGTDADEEKEEPAPVVQKKADKPVPKAAEVAPKAVTKAAGPAVSKPFRKPPEESDDEAPMEVEAPPKRKSDAAPGPDVRVTEGMELAEARRRMVAWARSPARRPGQGFPIDLFDRRVVFQVKAKDNFPHDLVQYADKLAKG